jgi:hypothetical protein
MGEPVDARYPIGKFAAPETITELDLKEAIWTLAELPQRMREEVEALTHDQQNLPYREGGWTVRQVVHHVADSHMNAVIRVHLALTEDWPTIKAYDEAAWARLHDYEAPVEWSLASIENLHARWVMLLQSLDEAQWQRGFVHPERGRSTIQQATLLYQWHSKHHLAHIAGLRAKLTN